MSFYSKPLPCPECGMAMEEKKDACGTAYVHPQNEECRFDGWRYRDSETEEWNEVVRMVKREANPQPSRMEPLVCPMKRFGCCGR